MKNFDEWNETKKKVNFKDRAPVRLGEIYWCNLGLNIGVEQDGREDNFQRPVIIIKKFSDQIVLVAPLTTKIHKGDWYFDIDILGVKQQVILNQIKPIDTKRLTKGIGEISENELNKIIDAFIKLITI